MSEPRLHVEARGEGPVVALAHGFAGSARNLRGQVRALSDAYRVLTWDARGHARSEAPTEPTAYSLETLAGDFGRVLDGAGAERAVVGGLSLGAVSALGFAIAHPERVRGLVLAAFPAARRGARASGAVRDAGAFADAIERRGLEAAGAEHVWGPGSGLDRQGAALVRQGFLEHPPHALVQLLRRVLARLPEPEALASRWAPLELPTLWIAGGEDAGALAAGDVFAATGAPLRRVVVEGAGHVVNLAAPEAFNAALRDFLASLEPGGQAHAGRPTRGDAD